MGRVTGGISVSFGFVTVIALLAYWGNGGILPFLTAVAIHEVAHICCIFLCGYAIKKAKFSYGGIKIEITSKGSTLFKEVLISLSGSMAGIIFASFFALMGMREYFFTNLVLSIFNLLPITGLDGGKVLFEIFTTASPVHGQGYAEFVSWCTTTILLFMGAVLYMMNFPSGGLLFTAGIILLVAALLKKN